MFTLKKFVKGRIEQTKCSSWEEQAWIVQWLPFSAPWLVNDCSYYIPSFLCEENVLQDTAKCETQKPAWVRIWRKYSDRAEAVQIISSSQSWKSLRICIKYFKQLQNNLFILFWGPALGYLFPRFVDGTAEQLPQIVSQIRNTKKVELQNVPGWDRTVRTLWITSMPNKHRLDPSVLNEDFLTAPGDDLLLPRPSTETMETSPIFWKELVVSLFQDFIGHCQSTFIEMPQDWRKEGTNLSVLSGKAWTVTVTLILKSNEVRGMQHQKMYAHHYREKLLESISQFLSTMKRLVYFWETGDLNSIEHQASIKERKCSLL